MSDLVPLLLRQFAYVRRQPEGRLLLALPRLASFIESEPRLVAITDDLRGEYERALASYRDVDRQLAQRLLALWDERGSWFMEAWDAAVAAEPGNVAWEAWGGPPPRIVERLSKAGEHRIDTFGEQGDPSAIGGVLPSMRHWMACVDDQIEWNDDGEPQSSFLATVGQIESDHDRARRAFLVANRTSAGAAWIRVCSFASSLIPPSSVHSVLDDGWAMLGKYLNVLPQRRVGNAALGLGVYDHEKGDVGKYREQLLRDLELLEEELLHRIGLHVSRRALVQRFKARCERFEARNLREAIAADQTRGAENVLTLAAAKFLFDAGLNPLFNAQIVTLRPDLFDLTAPSALYVEAKQYTEVPRAMLLKSAWQIWDTWNELDAQHRVTEAFLLVFRRSGPLATFDEVVRHGQRTLYPMLIDIAETNTKGSRASERPVHISADDLRPAASGSDL